MQDADIRTGIDWSRSIPRDRIFDPVIAELTGPGERVLDLGCGRGDLLDRLKKEKKIMELGIELDPEHVADCLSRGLSVIQGDMEESVADFEDDYFDLVVMNQVMLSVKDPLYLLENSLRISRRVVVSFPNFAHWKIRLQIMFKGRLPVNRDLPYEWYNTPNIRLSTVDDFEILCAKIKAGIDQRYFAGQDAKGRFAKISFWPNLRSSLALFCLSRTSGVL